jgi:hypothetical protein
MASTTNSSEDSVVRIMDAIRLEFVNIPTADECTKFKIEMNVDSIIEITCTFSPTVKDEKKV